MNTTLQVDDRRAFIEPMRALCIRHGKKIDDPVGKPPESRYGSASDGERSEVIKMNIDCIETGQFLMDQLL